MIGVFDSGVGGLSVHRALVQRLPQADFTYLADQANAPYGVRTGEDIVALTRDGCVRLFERGANLVVLACNTASAIALRRLQQTWLPGYRREIGRPVNILGIIVPTIEKATGLPWEHEAERRGEKVQQLDILGVFATQATVRSRVYEIEIDKRKQDLAVFSEACPDLVPLIEGDASAVDLAQAVEARVQALKTRIGRHPDRVVLGCTHYQIIADIFRAALPAGTPLIQQPEATAEGLALYLERHPEYDPGTGTSRVFLTTGTPGPQNGLVQSFWGGPLAFEAA
ncbi:glutamate racemase [Caulobacter vibrioides]|uniref:Glutamate racemase n=1 Tax=Caulobacter vibrioides TaxID=155892 RepID=A0A290MUW2_CAUVI|nr:aspartate/glutamate racemase family protein [Caulobacter vibrioides]ATC33662.1 glutamate racemase [Caulobacter vibrioides]